MYVKTICPYCGVGCSFFLQVDDGKVTKVVENKNDPISEGHPCIKGLSSWETIYAEDRYKTPMIRKKGKLVETTWDEAYNYIYENMKDLKPDEVMFYGSSPSTNEDNYLLQKMAREIFKTDNVDSCARLCHAATCYAFDKIFGISAMPAKIEDWKAADCILIIGSNPESNYPVAFTQKILAAKKNGAKIIVVSVWKEQTAEQADLYIEIEGGTETVFFSAILKHLVDNQDAKVPKDIEETISKIKMPDVVNQCKITKQEFDKAVAMIAASKRFVLGFGMGITQHVCGVDNIFAACNLVLAKKGKIISMRGKANIQGVGDMGCQPEKGGKTMTTAMFLEPVKAFYIMESNPAQSMPNLNKVHDELKKKFVVIHTTYPNLTAEKFADVVLPCCTWAERSGTFTNAESRIRFVNKAIEPMYNTKPNYVILTELALKFGKKFPNKIDDILKEIAQKRPGYEILDLDKLKSEKGQFVNREPKFQKYHLLLCKGEDVKPTKKYPFLLTTARIPFQFCTGEMSSRSATLNKMAPEALCLIDPVDAKKYGIKDMQMIRIISEVGEIEIKASLTDKTAPGLLIAPYHYEKTLINKLVPLNFNSQVEEPNLKKIPVRIEAI